MNNVKIFNGNQHFFSMFITMLSLLLPVQALQRTVPPIHPSHPFVIMSNAPSELCDQHFSMPLDLSYFHFVSSTMKTAINQSVSMFYTDRFGIYPYVEEATGKMHNDGLPQLMDMQKHLDVAKNDIEYYIPADQPGIAVLDFEDWRPQWDRNWGSKDIYRQISAENVQKKYSNMTEDEATYLAKSDFENGAKKFFIQSIRIGKKLRPKRLWGYYLFPDCYNYDYVQDIAGYTGECLDIEKSRDDELWWLWEESTALFPSIYLDMVLSNIQQGRLYVRHRIHEALRVTTSIGSYFIPIYAFIRPVFKDSTNDYLSEIDLVNTIGEAAALGAAGIVSWGGMDIAKTQKTCFEAQQHLELVMNPYILNVSKATQQCSEVLCQGQGRCVRKQWDKDVFLHLDPRRYQIQRQGPGGKLTVNGSISQEDINWFDIHFDCMCYTQAPCRSVLMIDDINDVDTIPAGNRGANRSDLKLLMILLFLMSALL